MAAGMLQSMAPSLRVGRTLSKHVPLKVTWTWRMREFCSRIDVRQSWNSLTGSQKQAWQVLGVEGAQMWKRLSQPDDESVKLLKLKRFDNLTAAQQAAVIHGLRLDVAAWDAFVENRKSQQLEIAQEHAELAESGRDVARSGLADSLLSSAWSITKRYGPALGAVLSDAGKGTMGRTSRGSGGAVAAVAAVAGQLLEMLPWIVDLREGQVQVEELETVNFLGLPKFDSWDAA
eukprot:s50_g36.t1